MVAVPLFGFLPICAANMGTCLSGIAVIHQTTNLDFHILGAIRNRIGICIRTTGKSSCQSHSLFFQVLCRSPSAETPDGFPLLCLGGHRQKVSRENQKIIKIFLGGNKTISFLVFIGHYRVKVSCKNQKATHFKQCGERRKEPFPTHTLSIKSTTSLFVIPA